MLCVNDRFTVVSIGLLALWAAPVKVLIDSEIFSNSLVAVGEEFCNVTEIVRNVNKFEHYRVVNK